jgi:uncharacterized protein YndB with AHSA1/START domain
MLGRSGMANIVAKAEIEIDAPPNEVWRALTDADTITKYFFGAKVSTDWRPGSPIIWSGEYNGKPFVDKGEIQDVEDGRLLRMTHFSPMSGLPDKPESYHTLTYELHERRSGTYVTLTQDNNRDQAEADHATANWTAMLKGLKNAVESR